MIKFYSTSKEYNWLSNFYESEMVIDEEVYHTNEHYYQSEKFTNDDRLSTWISMAPHPKYIYLLTRMIKKEVVDNWENIKFDIMLKGLRAKFSQNPELKQKLLDTGDEILHEDSSDKVWGINGEDMLGKLLMKVRKELVDIKK